MTRCTFFYLALTLVLCPDLNAQRINETTSGELNNLKATFKDDDIVSYEASSVYDFVFNKAEQGMQVKHRHRNHLVALKGHISHSIKNYYNDKSYIDSYSIKSEKGKNVVHDKYCGHYQQGDIFYSDAQVCAYKFKIDLQGQAVIYESTTVYKDPKYLTHVFFHDELASKKREIVVHVPGWADVDLKEMNFDNYDIKKTVEAQADGTKTYRYWLENIEAVPDGKNLPGYLQFLPHILILTKSYTANGTKVPVLSSTDDLYKWYSSLTHSLNKKTDVLKPLVNELTNGLKSKKEKIKAIYYWVQDNIKYIAFEDGLAAFKPEEASEVFYKRYGDCKGMANLTKEMLLLAGFDARLTWIGTDRIPYTYDVPSLAVNNHMICTVFDGNDRYVLDPTEKYNAIGVHAERIQGKEILIEDGSNYIISSVPEEPIDHYLQDWEWIYEVNDGALKGKGKTTINGEYKKVLMNVMNTVKSEDVDKVLRVIVANGQSPDQINIKEHSALNREEALQITYDIDMQDKMSSFDGEVYLDLDYADDYKNSKVEKGRNIPYKFGSKAYKRFRAELCIPDGFKLLHLPEALQVKNDHFEFMAKYEVVGNKILYSKQIKINKSVLPVTEFENWNRAIDAMGKFYDDQVILQSK